MAKGYGSDMMANMANAFAQKPAEIVQDQVPGASMHEGRRGLQGAATIDIGRLCPDPDQPRKTFDEVDLQRLGDSMKDIGQLQSIRVRWVETLGRYVIIAGERRYRAALKVGLPSLTCQVIADNQTDDERLEAQIVENALREDIGAVEKAHAWKKLATLRGYTQEQLAEKLKVGQELVSRTLKILELPTEVQDIAEEGKVPVSLLYEVSKVEDPAEQAELVTQAAAGTLKRAELRERVAKSTGKSKGEGRGASKGKPKVAPLPTERKHKATNGIKVIGDRRKGFTVAEWISALEEATDAARASMVEQGGSAEEQPAEAA